MSGTRRSHLSAAGGRARAFTLIELLIVVGIIAVVVAVLIPSLIGSRAAALTANCSANLAQLGKAMQSYATANDWCLPPVLTQNFSGATKTGSPENWATTLVRTKFIDGYPVVTDLNAPSTRSTPFYCPAGASELISDDYINTTAFHVNPTSPNGVEGMRGKRQFSAGLNAYVDFWYMMPGDTAANRGGAPWLYRAVPSDERSMVGLIRIPQLTRTSEIVLLVDGIAEMNITAVSNPPAGTSSSTGGLNRFSGRHGNTNKLETSTINVLFVDGHVENVARTKFPHFISDGTTSTVKVGVSGLAPPMRWK